MKNVRNEIGSEFWDVPTTHEVNHLFPDETRWFVSGTSALYFIIAQISQKHQIRKVAIPSWCCNCLITPFLNYGIHVYFYPIIADDSGGVIADYSGTSNCEVTIIMNYFGFGLLKTIGQPHGIILEDCTHSLFLPRNEKADYYFGSLRKWAGFYTGGYAWTRCSWENNQKYSNLDLGYLNIRQSAMKHKMAYLEGAANSKGYLNEFEKGEDLLDKYRIMSGAPEDELRARHFHIPFVFQKRRQNAKVLLESFNKLSLFKKLDDNDCPLFVPLVMDPTTRDE